MIHLKTLEKQEQSTPEMVCGKRLSKSGQKLMKQTKIIERFNEIKNWFFGKINTIDKPLDKLKTIYINNIRFKRRSIIIDTQEIQRIICRLYMQLENLKEMNDE